MVTAGLCSFSSLRDSAAWSRITVSDLSAQRQEGLGEWGREERRDRNWDWELREWTQRNSKWLLKQFSFTRVWVSLSGSWGRVPVGWRCAQREDCERKKLEVVRQEANLGEAALRLGVSGHSVSGKTFDMVKMGPILGIFNSFEYLTWSA